MLGKLTGSDEKNGKITSLSYLSISEAEAEVCRLTNEAIKIISKYYSSENQPRTDLASYMVNREK